MRLHLLYPISKAYNKITKRHAAVIEPHHTLTEIQECPTFGDLRTEINSHTPIDKISID